MFNEISGDTPYCCSNNTSGLENVPRSTNRESARDQLADGATTTQKADIIAKETLIKVSGTEDHWVSLHNLKSQSGVFRRLFLYDFKESKTHELKLENEGLENPKAADQFIQYLETGKSQINEENFQELLSLACKYEVPRLVKDFEQFVVLNLTSDNVLSVIKNIAVPYDLQDLLGNCFTYLFKNKDSLNDNFIKEIQALGEELSLPELKIIASEALKPYVSISENSSYLFDIKMPGDVFAQNIELLIQIFSEKSINEPSVNLRIYLVNLSAVVEFFKSNPKLTSIDLGWNGIGIAGQGHNQVVALLATLQKNTALKSLDLFHNSIGDNGAIEIAAMLQENTTLTSLNLFHNNIGDRGALVIATALKKNKTLTSLHLSGNGIGREGAIQIAAALKENKTLTNLHLGGNYIRDDGTAQIAAALKENTTLTNLNLGWNEIGDKGAILIAEALKENKMLTNLMLENSGIGGAGARQIALALRENKTLTSLDLFWNKIGGEGAAQIAAALKKNTTLTNLHLRTNEIGDEGAIQIAAALKENKTLTSLDLEFNGIRDHGAIHIAAALKENKTLTGLVLRNNHIGDVVVALIKAALEENRRCVS
jgi:Ran GTPase-activating protein (RanGAP) involved in mRNA processing and transport